MKLALMADRQGPPFSIKDVDGAAFNGPANRHRRSRCFLRIETMDHAAHRSFCGTVFVVQDHAAAEMIVHPSCQACGQGFTADYQRMQSFAPRAVVLNKRKMAWRKLDHRNIGRLEKGLNDAALLIVAEDADGRTAQERRDHRSNSE